MFHRYHQNALRESPEGPEGYNRLTLVGQTLSHFKITAKLGEGGMGEVYRAEDTKLGREVAIKVLPQAFVEDADRLARFEREAKVLASFNHPNIAGIYEVGQQDETHFLVMELAHGDTLAKRIERGPIPIEEALPLALQIARGLEQAHEQGIVHRDLKPANVVVEAASSVKILDFGLAKAWVGPSEPGSGLSEAPTFAAEMTQPGVVLGTAAYMSPEQANGEDADKRSDIWSFGVILEEMLSGHRMFQGPSLSATLAAVLRDPVTLEHLPVETPTAVKLLIARCLRRDRSKRLRDVGEARIGLESAIGAEVSSPLMAAVLGEAKAEKRGKPRTSWLMGGLGLLVAATAAMTIWSLIRPSEVDLPTSRLVISVPSEQQLRIGDSAYPMALSGDGQRLAYVAAVSGGEPSLFVRDLSTFDTRSIPGTEGAWYPFFPLVPDWPLGPCCKLTAVDSVSPGWSGDESRFGPTHASYRARRPERTVLYRALAHHFERFLLAYEERFEPTHGYLRRCVEPAVHRYLDCGIFDQG